MSSTPPTPTAPMNNPTTVATAASTRVEAISICSAGGEAGELAGEEHREPFHHCVAQTVIALHELVQVFPRERDDTARRQAISGRDPARIALDERGPAEHVAAVHELARRCLALAQSERETHHAVGQHIKIVDGIADRVDARVLRI